jgi:hypothetical protein
MDLPENYTDFKKEIKNSFPQIYDTKYMINNEEKLI